MPAPLPPTADPSAFFAWYYITGAAAGDPLLVLKLAVISSLIVFPFALAGKSMYGRMHGGRLRFFAAGIAAVTLFWIAAGAWRSANGLPFFHENFATSLIASWIAGLIFALAGARLYAKMAEDWKVPGLLAAYASCFTLSLVFWVFVWFAIQTLGV